MRLALLLSFIAVSASAQPRAAKPAASSRKPPAASAQSRELAAKAEQARQAGRLNEALLAYRDAVNLDPAWAEGWWAQAVILYEQDRFPEAELALERLVVLDPKPGPALALLGLCEYELGDYVSALRRFRNWEAAGAKGTPEIAAVARFHWALLLIRAGRFENAEYLLRAAVRDGVRGPELTEAAGLASLRMAMLPAEYAPERREVVYGAGKAALRVYRWEKSRALAQLADLARRYPAAAGLHHFYGVVLLSSDPDAALREFRRELEISPTNSATMVQIVSCHLAKNETAEALRMAERAVKAEPGAFGPHATLGAVYLELERAEDGIRELELARQLAPSNARVRLLLSRAYQLGRRPEEAQRELAAFRKLRAEEDRLAAAAGEPLK